MKAVNKTIYPETFHGLTSGKEVHLKIKDELINALGFFCSYCEIPLGGYEVEHHKDFAEWRSAKISDWPDLLLICKDCREHIVTPVLSESQHSEMLWPDEDLTFTLKNLSAFIYVPKQVTYRVVDHSGEKVSEEKKELVFILPNLEADESTQRMARNTIDHFQLNMRREYHSGHSGMITVPAFAHDQMLDNRMFERTRAWKVATEAAERYKMMQESLPPSHSEELLKKLHEQITMNAFFKGNWSVWMTVFWNHFHNHELLHTLFSGNQQHLFGNIK